MGKRKRKSRAEVGTPKWFILELTKREGKKHQVNVADASEMYARIVDMVCERPLTVLGCLMRSAHKKLSSGCGGRKK